MCRRFHLKVRTFPELYGLHWHSPVITHDGVVATIKTGQLSLSTKFCRKSALVLASTHFTADSTASTVVFVWQYKVKTMTTSDILLSVQWLSQVHHRHLSIPIHRWHCRIQVDVWQTAECYSCKSRCQLVGPTFCFEQSNTDEQSSLEKWLAAKLELVEQLSVSISAWQTWLTGNLQISAWTFFGSLGDINRLTCNGEGEGEGVSQPTKCFCIVSFLFPNWNLSRKLVEKLRWWKRNCFDWKHIFDSH